MARYVCVYVCGCVVPGMCVCGVCVYVVCVYVYLGRWCICRYAVYGVCLCACVCMKIGVSGTNPFLPTNLKKIK